MCAAFLTIAALFRVMRKLHRWPAVRVPYVDMGDRCPGLGCIDTRGRNLSGRARQARMLLEGRLVASDSAAQDGLTHGFVCISSSGHVIQ